MMTSRTFLPTRDDNCAGTLRMQSRILEAAHLMQERVHYVLFVCLFNDAVLPTLTFRHRASCILGQAFHYSPENVFIYLINKYISLSDICLTVHH